MLRRHVKPGQRFYYLYCGAPGHFSWTAIDGETDDGPGHVGVHPARVTWDVALVDADYQAELERRIHDVCTDPTLETMRAEDFGRWLADLQFGSG